MQKSGSSSQVAKPKPYVVRLPSGFLGEWGGMAKGGYQTVVLAKSAEDAFEVASLCDCWEQLPFDVEGCQAFPKDPYAR